MAQCSCSCPEWKIGWRLALGVDPASDPEEAAAFVESLRQLDLDCPTTWEVARHMGSNPRFDGNDFRFVDSPLHREQNVRAISPRIGLILGASGGLGRAYTRDAIADVAVIRAAPGRRSG